MKYTEWFNLHLMATVLCIIHSTTPTYCKLYTVGLNQLTMLFYNGSKWQEW